MDSETEVYLWLQFACAVLSGCAANSRIAGDGVDTVAGFAADTADAMLHRVRKRWPVADDDEPDAAVPAEPKPPSPPAGAGG